MNKLFKLDQPHGLGRVNLCWQRGSGGYLATAGTDSSVAIFNRNGKLVERLSLPGICSSFGWDRDGDLLGIVALNSSTLFLWDSNNHRKHQLDCGLRDPLSCVLWSKNGHTLAVTTTKGNLCIYNHTTSRRIPVLGKHAKAITCGSWNIDNLLALGSEDRTISINNIEGDTLKIIPVRADPSCISFSEMKVDEKCPGENTVSVIVGKKTLFLFNLQDPENPIELAFQSRYGSIVRYQWFGDGYILIGFSDGFFISISTHVREIGQELFQSKNHKECLNDIVLSASSGKVASSGDNCIKVHEIGNLGETVSVMIIEDDAGVDQLAWSEDGQLLAASTTYGCVHMYLSKLPMLASAHFNYICMLTSLSQITINSCSFDMDRKIESVVMETEIDPSFLCIGPYHLAIGMNNRIWFYELVHESSEDGFVSSVLKIPKYLFDREYLGTITTVQLNGEYVSVFFEGKIHLHLIDSTATTSNGNEKETKIFPDDNEKLLITSQCLTADFLIYTSNQGHIRYFCLEEWKSAVDYQHFVPIKSIYPNNDGVRCVFIDSKSDGYLYNPINDTILKISNFPASAVGVLWELWHVEKHIFMVYDSRLAYIFAYFRDSIDGPGVYLVGEVKLPISHLPLIIHQGQLYSETTSGKLTHSLLSTHQVSASLMKKDQKRSLEENLNKHLALLKYSEASNLCRVLDNRDCWIKLATTALTYMNIDRAIEVYSYLDDISMVLSLRGLKYIEDKNLLAGKVCVILGNFDKAQDLYLDSSDPVQALYLRQDLLQWDIALQLAKNLAPNRIPQISREYGNQLELIGRYTEALKHYERGLVDLEEQNEKHVSDCYAGIARTSIRNGDYQRGLQIVTNSSSTKQLKSECAELFENVKKLNEAATLYEEAENYNQAAVCYIRLKNWTKIGSILPHVSSSKIYSQYAKAMEAIGNHRKAVEAYELARDYTNTIRLILDRLNDPQEAVRIVQETRSIEGAKMVARYFQKTGDILSAIKFLVMSACYEEAFKLAENNNQLELYGDVLIDETPDGETVSEFLVLAEWFEKTNKCLLAGKYYFHGKQYRKAIKLLLTAARDSPEDEDVLSLAIDVVAAANDDTLSNQVIHLLLGEIDGETRDPKFVFRLYMAKKEYRAAAKTAIIIATEEQINGNYRRAHDILFTMSFELRLNNLKIGAEMVANLMLLHSYILVRIHVKRNDHAKAAILLVRVADNISKFPAHTVPILTSAVIECHKANMKSSSFSFASILMKPEFRNQIDTKYRKKIEGIIRKSPKGNLTDDINIESTPCPYCDNPLLCTQLSCSNCHNNIPFCIITGWHVTKDNLTACPNCHFPALYSEFIELLESFDYCPMCSEKVSKSHLYMVTDPQPYLYQEGTE